ncbi:DsbA family oxidoreductase [Hwanghaeella sp.]|uniref:DsbA family oxidoreductase n=1 Tax=Hwanghaeella sp. TaxID=2605943 RepID=UPI003CCBDFB7
MIVDIFSDPICPWCFIGKKRLKEALVLRPDLPVTVRWRAFQLNPDMPAEGMDRQTYLNVKFGGADRAGQIYGRIRDVGSAVGIDFQFDKISRTPNTVPAHRLIRYAQRPGIDKANEVTDLLFDAYFLNGALIGELDTLLDIGETAGIDRDALEAYFETDEDTDEILAEDQHARRLGIGGVPCFIIDGKYALSGAQEAESFLPIFDMAAQEAAKEPATQA